jgi:tRNA dimethylallyltransferase
MAEKKQQKGKVLVILGPNASGKSSTAIALARKFNGEVISADSRQVYRGMDIGSGKVEGKMQTIDRKPAFVSEGIPHYMIDVVDPKTEYSVAKFKREVYKLIPWIIERGKLPIICGGTMFWVSTVVDNLEFPKVVPNSALRAELFKLDTDKLFERLKKRDPERASVIDPKNKVRLIRALEVCEQAEKVGELKKGPALYDFFQIGITWPREVLNERIRKRMEERFDKGIVDEVQVLHEEGLSWSRMERFGLEYRYISRYLRGKLTFEEMKEQLYIAIRQYAKRQMTWFKRDKRIIWKNNLGNMVVLIENWL